MLSNCKLASSVVKLNTSVSDSLYAVVVVACVVSPRDSSVVIKILLVSFVVLLVGTVGMLIVCCFGATVLSVGAK